MNGVYTISGFANASGAIPLTDQTTFSLQVVVVDAEDQGRTHSFHFQPHIDGMQYISGSFVIDNISGVGVKSIELICNFDYQNGEVTFSDLRVEKCTDNSAVHYTYYSSLDHSEYKRGKVMTETTALYTKTTDYDGGSGKPDDVRTTYIDGSSVQELHQYDGITHLLTHSEISYYYHDISNFEDRISDYTYNAFGQLTKTESYAYKYVEGDEEESSLLVSETAYVTTPGSYIFGAVFSETNTAGDSTYYQYDPATGNLVYTRDELTNGLFYAYDGAGRVTSVSPLDYSSYDGSYGADITGENVRYEYDDQKRVSEIITESTTYGFTYDCFGNTTSISANGTLLATYEYAANNGNLESTTNGRGDRTEYEYDTLDRLTKIWYTESGQAKTLQCEYTYTGDRLDGTTYDAIGNPANYNGYALTWDGRQLEHMYNGFVSMLFTYNSDGIRTSKSPWGIKHTYTLNGSQIVSEAWGNQALIYLYDESGAPIGMLHCNSTGGFVTYYFEKNLQGDIIAVYDATGKKLGGYTYDAWGACTVTYATGTTSAEQNTVMYLNPFRMRRETRTRYDRVG